MKKRNPTKKCSICQETKRIFSGSRCHKCYLVSSGKYKKHKIQNRLKMRENRKDIKFVRKERENALKFYYSKKGVKYNISPVRRLSVVRSAAKIKKFKFNIDLKNYTNLINRPCIYCNKSLIKETGGSLDRINNKKGYTLDNVIQCCWTCNNLRSNILTHEEMKVAMKAVLKYRKVNKIESKK